MADEHPPQQPLEYASKGDPERIDQEISRGLVKWVQLLLVWLVGLGVWVVYIAALLYLFVRLIG